MLSSLTYTYQTGDEIAFLRRLQDQGKYDQLIKLKHLNHFRVWDGEDMDVSRKEVESELNRLLALRLEDSEEDY